MRGFAKHGSASRGLARHPVVVALAVALAAALGACGDAAPPAGFACGVAAGTVSIPAAQVRLGEPRLYPEEQPRQATLAAFDIDRTEVTNAQFRRFVEETGYVTTAERPQPGTWAGTGAGTGAAGEGVAGGAVFRTPTPTHPSWWRFVEGANWRHPEGPGSTIEGLDTHPVVQVSLEDARAYAEWAGRAIPVEDQWEYAARGAPSGEGPSTVYPWGDSRTEGGRFHANTWQGAFPIADTAEDGFAGRAPAGCFGANALGVHDMIGNVWEWTETPFTFRGGPPGFMIKGGSFLCADTYCRRDRAPSRQSQEADFSTNHIGFRTVSRTVVPDAPGEGFTPG